jgi:hypothetical protein
VYHDLFFGSPITCPAQVLIPRHVIEAMGPVCVAPNGGQDYDYYVRIARSYDATFHRASLAQWRFRPESMSGGHEQRELRWAVNMLVVLDREARLCSSADRRVLRAGMARHARVGVTFACEARAARGTAPDRGDLATLYRVAPHVPRVVAARLILALPRPLDRLALRTVGIARGMMRALRQRRYRRPNGRG